MNTQGRTEQLSGEWGRSILGQCQCNVQMGMYADALGSQVISLVSRASPARDGAAGTTSLPLCAQTGMTAVTFYSLIVPLSRITWEFISFSTIIQIGDIHDLSGFSY